MFAAGVMFLSKKRANASQNLRSLQERALAHGYASGAFPRTSGRAPCAALAGSSVQGTKGVVRMCFRPAAIEIDRSCPACGAKCGMDDKACPECGAELPEEESPYFVPGSSAAGMPGVPGVPAAPGAPGAPRPLALRERLACLQPPASRRRQGARARSCGGRSRAVSQAARERLRAVRTTRREEERA